MDIDLGHQYALIPRASTVAHRHRLCRHTESSLGRWKAESDNSSAHTRRRSSPPLQPPEDDSLVLRHYRSIVQAAQTAG